jgi:predicted amidohydrolase
MKIRVAGFQMPVSNEIRRNTDRICAAIRWAARARAEILLTPEGSLSGYRPDFDVQDAAGALDRVTALARRLRVGLALGTCFVEADGKCYNQVRFYRPSGEFLGFHSKTLLCAGLGRAASPKDEINHYAVRRLRVFSWAPRLTIGGLICNDLWANPQCTPMSDLHLSQRLAAKGARIIFHAVNGGRDGSENSKVAWQYHEANLRMRAQAGRLWIVTVDNSQPASLPCSAPSGVIDPHGRWVCRTKPRGTRFFVHTIDLAPGGRRKKNPGAAPAAVNPPKPSSPTSREPLASTRRRCLPVPR